MKTLATTLVLVLTTAISMAFNAGSLLTVEVLGHRPNSVIVINGQQFNSIQNVVQLNGLMPGRYPVKVLRPSQWNGHGLLFQGVINVPHRSNVRATITRRGMQVNATPLVHQHGASYWHGNQHGNGTVHVPNPNGNGGFVSVLPVHQPIVEPVVCSSPAFIGMHPNAFNQALSAIDNQAFDADQVRLARQIIRNNALSSHQIAQIMQRLSFERSRLEIAKFGYAFVADPQNYWVVNDAFSFASSVRELDRFIRG